MIHIRETQPGETFTFSAENEAEITRILARYPEERKASAVLPLLDLAQRQNDGWVPPAAIEHIAARLEMAPMRVWEVASFYTMINTDPVGRYLIQICRTTPCWLRGSDAVTDKLKELLGIGVGETTADGLFTILEVECLGACVNAPVVQINDDYYEDLLPEHIEALITKLKAGEQPQIGSQIGRIGSAPFAGSEAGGND